MHEISGDLRSDIEYLLKARILVVSRGSFSPAIATISKNLETVYYFEGVFNVFSLENPNVSCIRVIDKQGVYKSEILSSNWQNTESQRKLMLEYPANALDFDSEINYQITSKQINMDSNTLNPLNVNLALNKPTAQSSIYQPERYSYDPHGACNGEKTGKFGFHTFEENQPWWQIDLQGTYQLSRIKIYNRIDFKERASTLNILVSQDALNWELCYSNDPENLFGGSDGNPLTVDLQQKITRFVRLQLREIDTLHLDEVEIYGIPVKLDSSQLKFNQDENALAINFYLHHNVPPSFHAKQNLIMSMLKKLGMYDTELGKVRLGSKGDGGYVIPDDLTDIKGVISIGIGGEVSFDLEWAKMGVKVFQYDHTIEAPPVIHENFVFNKLGWGTQDSDGFITLPKMIETNHLEDGDLFLKFDVENAEWDALFDVSPDLLKRFRIIACELHGFDGLENMSVFQKVNRVINLLTTHHTVVHIHPNNCCGIALVAGIPLPKLIEFTFLRNDRASFYPSHASIPSALDYPNVRSKPEIVLTPFHLNEPRKLQTKNLALNKPTAQSSALAPEIYDYDPHGACNGKKTGRFGFHTCQENQPWWQIDLEETSQILEIKIYNRLDSSKERASTLNILLSQDALNWELCYSNDKNNIFGGTDGKPLTVNFQEKIARFVRLQLRENQYFHLDEVEIYGIPCTDNLDARSNDDQATLSANFYRQSYLPTALPPKKIPEELVADFTIGNKIPVINAYYNNTCSSPIYLSMQAYNQAFEQLSKSSFEYYGETLDYLLNALDKYSIFNKTVLIFGLVGINCDAISLWKGASQVYVIDYNLPISEHPQVQVFSYEDYISRNIQADIGISISSFEHDGLGRYGDPINPNGDLEAMKLSKTLIKKDGLFFFSVPIGKDCLVWNAHRIYGKIRLPMMFEGWELLNSFGFSDSLINDQDLGKFQQPVFVLKNL